MLAFVCPLVFCMFLKPLCSILSAAEFAESKMWFEVPCVEKIGKEIKMYLVPYWDSDVAVNPDILKYLGDRKALGL